MKILIQGLNFSPEITGIGKYTGEMATYLMDQGHHVKVVTASPYYPQWQILSGYSKWWYQKQSIPNQEVYRCPLWVPRNPSGIKRLAHLITYTLSCFPVMVFQIFWKPDIVFSIAPTFFAAPIGIMVARLCGALAWLHIHDFELDAANSLGLLKINRKSFPFFQFIEGFILKKFDYVSTISELMRNRLLQKGVSQERVYLFPNWVDINQISPMEGPNLLRNELGISDEEVMVLYSGNMGWKQGLEILIEAAKELSSRNDIKFILCGNGSARVDLETKACKLHNLKFIPLQPPERLNLLLNAADIHVLPQRADAADLVMPSKLLGMLASGKPVIATALNNTEIGGIVSKVGVLVPPENLDALVKSLIELANDRVRRINLGFSGRKYAIMYWDKDKILDCFSRDLESFAKMKDRPWKTP